VGDVGFASCAGIPNSGQNMRKIKSKPDLIQNIHK